MKLPDAFVIKSGIRDNKLTSTGILGTCLTGFASGSSGTQDKVNLMACADVKRSVLNFTEARNEVNTIKPVFRKLRCGVFSCLLLRVCHRDELQR